MHLDQIMARDRGCARGPDTTWRGCIRATRRSTAPSPSRSGAWTRSEIAWTITPGVPAFAAAAAALGGELTLPDVAQSVVVTRTAVRASAMPPGEDLAAFAATGATLCIHLSINNLAMIVRELTPIAGRRTCRWPSSTVSPGRTS